MILKIKGIRKWRVSMDEINWIIQEHKPKNKPPKDWVNRFYYQELENLFKGLHDLGIAEKRLSSIKGILDRQREIYAAIQRLAQMFSKELGVERLEVSDIFTKLTPVAAPKKKKKKASKGKGLPKKKKKAK